MSWNNRVVWSEGQFCCRRCFSSRNAIWSTSFITAACRCRPFLGFSKYEIDSEALNIGKLVLTEAAGVFADGTPFTAPGHTPLPPPLTILPEHLNQQICTGGAGTHAEQ